VSCRREAAGKAILRLGSREICSATDTNHEDDFAGRGRLCGLTLIPPSPYNQLMMEERKRKSIYERKRKEKKINLGTTRRPEVKKIDKHQNGSKTIVNLQLKVGTESATRSGRKSN